MTYSSLIGKMHCAGPLIILRMRMPDNIIFTTTSEIRRNVTLQCGFESEAFILPFILSLCEMQTFKHKPEWIKFECVVNEKCILNSWVWLWTRGSSQRPQRPMEIVYILLDGRSGWKPWQAQIEFWLSGHGRWSDCFSQKRLRYSNMVIPGWARAVAPSANVRNSFFPCGYIFIFFYFISKNEKDDLWFGTDHWP